MKYGCMIDQNGSMRRLVDATGNKVQLASEVTNIEEGAFDGVENVTTLLMPKNGENIGLEVNCPKQRDPEDSVLYKVTVPGGAGTAEGFRGIRGC